MSDSNPYSKENVCPLSFYLDREPVRMHVDQPSTLQPFHSMHGKNVLTMPPIIKCDDGDGDYIRAYFTEGAVVSSHIPLICLSTGWR